MVNILFVCSGNICRSPLAEGILRFKLNNLNIPAFIDSCGFESYHVGDPPDHRAMATASRHGIDISNHRGRLFTARDFDIFDVIYVMDSGHYRSAMKLARNEPDRSRVDYMLNVLYPGQNMGVVDPWYHDDVTFEKVFLQLEQACEVVTRKLFSGTNLL